MFTGFSIKRLLTSFKRVLRLSLCTPQCLFCGFKTACPGNLCQACQAVLPSLPQACQRCANPLSLLSETLVCGKCQHQPPPFARTFALFPYEYPIIQWISRLKFQGNLSYARLFSHLMHEQILQAWHATLPLPDVIIPIPLHPQRLRERGYNQSLEMARPIARSLQIEMDGYTTQRIRHTAPQSRLSAKAREDNVANAFQCSRDFTGCSVAVIDDVMTTGHTMTQFCHLLKAHGAREITVWCCARRG